MKTNGKCALVTGGTSGIGLELARCFAADGYDLVLVARDEAELRNTASELGIQHGVKVITIAKDLFDEQASQEVYDEVKSKGIEVNALVNNAGQGEYGFFHETDIERDMDIVKLNIIAPLYLTKLFVKDMIAKGEGKILNLASVVSKNPAPLFSVYSASKAFIYSWSIALRNELADKGITVTALLPGATETDFFNKAGMLNTKENVEYAHADPADVAKTGYDALMNNEEKVIAGAKNKMMATMANITPDSALAANMRDHMQNVDGPEGKAGASEGEAEREGLRQAAGHTPGTPSSGNTPRGEE
ncbi:MAG TPA: SDR family oxidoreductase [Flavipsychrobacter sp.]|nr:SDR family oxidoreductase [Flavipsychrobacter sp.]